MTTDGGPDRQGGVDAEFMRTALVLGARGLGSTWPNPAVGCVVVRDGRVVGRGWTQPGGRPHAETEALGRAGDRARGATAYVTLEPCAHHGRTPPCTDALIAAGVVRVVIGAGDPDLRVAGQGIDRLRAAGIVVETGVLAEEAHEANLGYFLHRSRNRPLVALKFATSLDGRIAVAGGDSRWITGPVARAWGHGLRARHDAILVGWGTARTDNPSLTCRLPGLAGRSPVRVVLAGASAPAELPAALSAAEDGPPVWLAVPRARAARFEGVGDAVLACDEAEGRPDPASLLASLAARGITRLLVEGGGAVAAAFLRAGLVDLIYWFRAPLLLGGDGVPAVAALGVDAVADGRRWRRTGFRTAGDDLLETFAVLD